MNTLLTSWAILIIGIWTSTDEQTVIAKDQELNQLILTHNAKSAADLYADDFILTTSSGKMKTKQDMLTDIASPELTLEINETTNVKVRVLHDTAVLTGILQQAGTYKNNRFDVKLYVTDTWVRTKGTWVLLAGHATPLAAK